MLYKSCPAKVKAAAEQDGLEAGQFEAVVAVFGNVDSFGDLIKPGAFTETLADWKSRGDPIPVYYSHRMDDPDYNIGYVLDASETDEGLSIKAQLDMDPEARKAAQVYRLLKGRRITQFSFAYDIEDAGFGTKDGEDVFELRKLKLYEAGPTPIGANQETELIGVKTAAQGWAHSVKSGRVLAEKHLSKLREAHDALGEVLAAAEPDDGKAGETNEKTSAPDEDADRKDSETKAVEPESGNSPMRPCTVDLSALLEIELA
jgi:HK97 family phage prohead protease